MGNFGERQWEISVSAINQRARDVIAAHSQQPATLIDRSREDAQRHQWARPAANWGHRDRKTVRMGLVFSRWV